MMPSDGQFAEALRIAEDSVIDCEIVVRDCSAEVRRSLHALTEARWQLARARQYLEYLTRLAGLP